MASMALIDRDILIFVLKPSLLEVTRHGRCVRLSVLKSFWRSVVTFWSVPKSNMAVLVSNWPRHVLLIFQENSIQTLQKCSSRDPIFVFLGWKLQKLLSAESSHWITLNSSISNGFFSWTKKDNSSWKLNIYFKDFRL